MFHIMIKDIKTIVLFPLRIKPKTTKLETTKSGHMKNNGSLYMH